ncbi:hypothetical protein MRX96_033255 [Rhipicephalus microplus]
MESDQESSKWKPVFTRLMAILQNFNSLPAAEETKEDQASTPQMDVAQAKQKLLDYLEKADTVLVKARSLRQADSGDGASKNKRHTTKITNPSTVASKKIDDRQPDKPQVVTRTTVPKQGARSRSRSVVTGEKGGHRQRQAALYVPVAKPEAAPAAESAKEKR